MILLTTHEARVVHAVVEFGPVARDLMSEADKGHLTSARAKLTNHVHAFVESHTAALRSNSKEPA